MPIDCWDDGADEAGDEMEDPGSRADGPLDARFPPPATHDLENVS